MSEYNKNAVRTIALKRWAIVLVAILILLVGLVLLMIWEKNNNEYPDNHQKLDETISYNGNEYVLKDDIETILIIGLDKFEKGEDVSYNNDKQADFLVLLVIDNTNQSCQAIHINRDTMVEIDVLGVAGDKIDTTVKQIALSHTYGNGREVSCRNTANAVSGLLLGMEVDHYVSVTMEAVPVYNDLIGGVTLEVLDDFTGIDDTLVKGETVTLTGEQALCYVRSRYGLEDSTNQRRMERQKQYLEALHSKSRQLVAEDDSFIASTALKMTDYLVSDCSGNRLEALLNRLSEYDINTVLDISGNSVVGEEFMEFYPDEDSVMNIVVECFYELKDPK